MPILTCSHSICGYVVSQAHRRQSRQLWRADPPAVGAPGRRRATSAGAPTGTGRRAGTRRRRPTRRPATFRGVRGGHLTAEACSPLSTPVELPSRADGVCRAVVSMIMSHRPQPCSVRLHEETSQEIILGELIKVQTSHWVGRSPYAQHRGFPRRTADLSRQLSASDRARSCSIRAAPPSRLSGCHWTRGVRCRGPRTGGCCSSELLNESAAG